MSNKNVSIYIVHKYCVCRLLTMSSICPTFLENDAMTIGIPVASSKRFQKVVTTSRSYKTGPLLVFLVAFLIWNWHVWDFIAGAKQLMLTLIGSTNGYMIALFHHYLITDFAGKYVQRNKYSIFKMDITVSANFKAIFTSSNLLNISIIL